MFDCPTLIAAVLGALCLASSSTALVAKDGKSGRLPPLGFNSWNAFRCDINQDKFLIAAQEMVKLGLKDAGYTYVNIDDCWSLKERDPITKRLVPDSTKFPTGIKGPADSIHKLGLKLGIYADAGTATCAGYPGSLGYEAIDATTWDEWGVDYLKYDNCNVPAEMTDKYTYWPERWYGGGTNEKQVGIPPPAGYDWSNSKSAKRYNAMRDALNRNATRNILYSLCNWGHSHVEQWGNNTGQSWRVWSDIAPLWDGQVGTGWGFMPILNHGIFFLEYSDFWGHNDLDMLEVGNGNLTEAETRSHFGLWAALKSPLLIGTPLDAIQDKDLKVLKNWEMLAFNQDPVYGKPALPYKWGINPDWTWNQTHPAEFYSGPSTRGVHAFVLNTLTTTATKIVTFTEIPGLSKDTKKKYEVRDMWNHKKLGVFKGKITLTLVAHDLAALLITEVGGGHPLPYEKCKQTRSRIALPETYMRKPSSWGVGPVEF